MPGPALCRCSNCSLAEPGHEAAGYRSLGGQGASAVSLVGRAKFLKTPGLLPDPGVSARLLAGRAGSWSLPAGPRGSRPHFRSLGWGWEQFLIQLGMGSRVS